MITLFRFDTSKGVHITFAGRFAGFRVESAAVLVRGKRAGIRLSGPWKSFGAVCKDRTCLAGLKCPAAWRLSESRGAGRQPLPHFGGLSPNALCCEL